MSPDAIVVGDNPGLFNYGDNENSFEKTGLMDAAGGHYRNLGDAMKKLPFIALIIMFLVSKWRL